LFESLDRNQRYRKNKSGLVFLVHSVHCLMEHRSCKCGASGWPDVCPDSGCLDVRRLISTILYAC